MVTKTTSLKVILGKFRCFEYRLIEVTVCGISQKRQKPMKEPVADR